MYFNPNYGYEPYWHHGQWFIKPDPLGPNETTTRASLVCGEECDPSYHGIGKLCAAMGYYYGLRGCWGQICYGEKFSDFTYRYQTFPNYCKFLDANCKLAYSHWYEWSIIYMGECISPPEKFFLPIVNNTIIYYRMTGYLASIASRLASVSFVTL